MALVQIARFDDAYEGEIAASTLRAAGLEVFFRNEGLGTIDPLLARAVGGHIFSVPESHAAEARTLLREYASARPAAPAAEDEDDDGEDFSAKRARRNRIAGWALISVMFGPVVLMAVYAVLERLWLAISS